MIEFFHRNIRLRKTIFCLKKISEFALLLSLIWLANVNLAETDVIVSDRVSLYNYPIINDNNVKFDKIFDFYYFIHDFVNEWQKIFVFYNNLIEIFIIHA